MWSGFLTGSGYGIIMPSCCVEVNELSGSIMGGEFIN
jgi:hypothetical protein